MSGPDTTVSLSRVLQPARAAGLFERDTAALEHKGPMKEHGWFLVRKDHSDSRKPGDNPDLTAGSVTQKLNNMTDYTKKCLPADSTMRALYIRNTEKKMIERYDRHVRLVKLSRDVATESKNVVMLLLHSPKTKDSSKNIIAEAEARLQMVIKGPIKLIGIENEHCPPIVHDHATTGGFQEYVKARIMLSLMRDKRIITYPEVQQELDYIIIDNYGQRTVITKLPRSDYILGLAELSVELMRKAANSISSGDAEECFEISEVLRHLYSGYLGVKNGAGFLNDKLPVTLANLHKVEQALLALRERYGAMRPYWMDGSKAMDNMYEYRRKYYGY